MRYSASFISGLAVKNPTWMTFKVADFVSEEGNPFPYVYLSTSRNASTMVPSRKLRVWIQGSVHGNEPAGDEATLALLGAMDANATWAASFLEAMDIVVLPRYNPDGNACKQNLYSLRIVLSIDLRHQIFNARWQQISTRIEIISNLHASKRATSNNGLVISHHTLLLTCTNTALPPATQQTTATPPTACTAPQKYFPLQ
jgi:hypothetical protein